MNLLKHLIFSSFSCTFTPKYGVNVIEVVTLRLLPLCRRHLPFQAVTSYTAVINGTMEEYGVNNPKNLWYEKGLHLFDCAVFSQRGNGTMGTTEFWNDKES